MPYFFKKWGFSEKTVVSSILIEFAWYCFTSIVENKTQNIIKNFVFWNSICWIIWYLLKCLKLLIYQKFDFSVFLFFDKLNAYQQVKNRVSRNTLCSKISIKKSWAYGQQCLVDDTFYLKMTIFLKIVTYWFFAVKVSHIYNARQ